MGSFGSNWKKVNDPFHLVTNRDQPVTLDSLQQATNPVGMFVGQQYNTDTSNAQGKLDPAQVFGSNSLKAPGPNPNAPGSIFNMGNRGIGQPYNPALMPAPGTATDGIANGYATNGLSTPPAINNTPNVPNGMGMQNGPMPAGPPQNSIWGGAGNAQNPNWSQVIANALRK